MSKYGKVDIRRIAMRVAFSEIFAFEMSLSEWKQYKQQHPAANPKHHTIYPDRPGEEPEVVKEHIKHKVKQKLKEKVKEKKPEEAPKKKHYKNQVRMTKQELQDTLTKGNYTIISAGRNPNNPEEAKREPDDEFFHKRHEQLQDELESLGVPYTQVVGHYGGKEPSFLVVHDDHELPQKIKKSQKGFMVRYKKDQQKDMHKKLADIGKKYNQDSVLHGYEGNNVIEFTTGKNAGKKCGGKGYKETPEAEDYYTEVDLRDKNHSKFNVNVDSCFEKGLL